MRGFDSRRFKWFAIVLMGAGAVLMVTVAVRAQGRYFGYGYRREPELHNVAYDGRFTFVRVKYTPAPDGWWAGGRPSCSPWVDTAPGPANRECSRYGPRGPVEEA